MIFSDSLDYVETHNDILGLCFLLTGAMLMLSQWLSQRNARRGAEKRQVGMSEAVAMGCLQAVGMLPGVSPQRFDHLWRHMRAPGPYYGCEV